MAGLSYVTNVSVDGCIEDPSGGLEWSRAERRVLRVHHRPRAPGRDLPLRAAPVRGDGGLGDGPHAGRAFGAPGGFRRRLALRREGRVLHDARGRPDGGHAARASLRPRGSPGHEVVRDPWSHHRRGRARRVRVRRRAWSTSATSSSIRRSSVAAGPPSLATRRSDSSCRTSAGSTTASCTSATPHGREARARVSDGREARRAGSAAERGRRRPGPGVRPGRRRAGASRRGARARPGPRRGRRSARQPSTTRDPASAAASMRFSTAAPSDSSAMPHSARRRASSG